MYDYASQAAELLDPFPYITITSIVTEFQSYGFPARRITSHQCLVQSGSPFRLLNRRECMYTYFV